MSEREIVTTVEITQILRDVPECFEFDKEAHIENVKKFVASGIKADNIIVKVHDTPLQGLRDQMDDEV